MIFCVVQSFVFAVTGFDRFRLTYSYHSRISRCFQQLSLIEKFFPVWTKQQGQRRPRAEADANLHAGTDPTITFIRIACVQGSSFWRRLNAIAFSQQSFWDQWRWIKAWVLHYCLKCGKKKKSYSDEVSVMLAGIRQIKPLTLLSFKKRSCGIYAYRCCVAFV